MEDIDGGLHPAVGGQSLDEDEDEGTFSRWLSSDNLVALAVTEVGVIAVDVAKDTIIIIIIIIIVMMMMMMITTTTTTTTTRIIIIIIIIIII